MLKPSLSNAFIYLYLFAMSTLFLSACKTSSKEGELPEFKTLVFKNALYICNDHNKKCTFIQYASLPKVDDNVIKSLNYSKLEKKMVIVYLESESSIYQLDENIYGIGEVDAIRMSSDLGRLLNSHPGKRFIDLSSQSEPKEVSSVRCGCILNSQLSKPVNWTSGANGASQCGVTEGGGLQQVEQNNCHVSCAKGVATAYCSMEPKFITK